MTTAHVVPPMPESPEDRYINPSDWIEKQFKWRDLWLTLYDPEYRVKKAWLAVPPGKVF